MKHAGLQEREACPAIHLPLQAFQAIDLPFDLATAPGRGQSGYNGSLVVQYAPCESL